MKRTKTGKKYILTKGDYNPVDDRGLYNRGQLWIYEEDVIGRVYGNWILLTKHMFRLWE
jgi:signal peptidase I